MAWEYVIEDTNPIRSAGYFIERRLGFNHFGPPGKAARYSHRSLAEAAARKHSLQRRSRVVRLDKVYATLAEACVQGLDKWASRAVPWLIGTKRTTEIVGREFELRVEYPPGTVLAEYITTLARYIEDFAPIGVHCEGLHGRLAVVARFAVAPAKANQPARCESRRLSCE